MHILPWPKNYPISRLLSMSRGKKSVGNLLLLGAPCCVCDVSVFVFYADLSCCSILLIWISQFRMRILLFASILALLNIITINLQCKECSDVFENSWSLHNHMQVKHLGPFPCPICDRNCPTTKLLKRHMLTHTKVESEQPNQSRRFVNYCKYLHVDAGGTISCKECQQTFDTRKRFRTHVVESHDKSKNFFCDQCEKAFTLAWQLNAHVESTVSIANLIVVQPNS